MVSPPGELIVIGYSSIRSGGQVTPKASHSGGRGGSDAIAATQVKDRATAELA